MTDDLTEGVAPADQTDEEVEVIATEIEQTRGEMTGTARRWRSPRSGEYRPGREGNRARGDGRKG